MSVDVPAAEGDLHGSTGPAIDGELSEPPFHATRESDRKLGQCTFEVLQVEPAVELFETVNQSEVTGPCPLPSGYPLGRWYVGMHRKLEKFALRGPAQRSRKARVQEPNDRLQDMVGSKPIPPVDSEHSPVQAQHDRLIGVGEDPVHLPQTQGLQPLR